MKTGFENSSNKTVLTFMVIGTILSVITLLAALVLLFIGGDVLIGSLICFVYSGACFAMLYCTRAEMKKRNYSKEETQGAKRIAMTLFVIFALILCTCIIIALTATGGSQNNKNKCTICGDEASYTFQGSRYCGEHYRNAVQWVADKANDK